MKKILVIIILSCMSFMNGSAFAQTPDPKCTLGNQNKVRSGCPIYKGNPEVSTINKLLGLIPREVGVRAENTSDSIVLNWTPVVYRMPFSTEWHKIILYGVWRMEAGKHSYTLVGSGLTPRYEDKTVKCNVSYTYRITAVGEEYQSPVFEMAKTVIRKTC